MTFKTILVHCDGDKALGQRLGVAVDLAAQFDSHLVGLHVRPPFQPPAYYDGSFVIDELYKLYEETADADQTAVVTAFSRATEGRNIAAERRVAEGPVDRELVRRSRYADLVVLGQTGTGTPTVTPLDLPEVVALSSGRPVVVVPYVEVKRPVGRKIILCWNASRESARAASDALPFLKSADEVAVLAVGTHDEESEKPDAEAAANWLAHHGVKATALADLAAGLDPAELILSRAADLDADLIVMGIYGHTRVREMVLGGVSRTLLRSMTVPVFMSH